jgi:hypothetical protein
MTSTISTAHRSQHLDGVENVLCASSFFPLSLKCGNFYLQWTINMTLLDTLGGMPFWVEGGEKNIKLFSGMELYRILRSDVNLPEQYINMHPYAGD